MSPTRRPILFLAETLGLGGTPKHLAELLPKLKERGFDVCLWCFSRPERYYFLMVDQGINVTVRKHMTPDLYVYLRRHPGTIVHSYLFADHLIDAVQAVSAGATYVMSTRNNGLWRSHKAWETLKLRLRRTLARRHIVNSQIAADHLVREEGVTPEAIRVIPNGIADLYHSWPALSRDDVGLSSQDFVLIVVQRLRRNKNTSFLVDRLPGLLPHCPNLLLLVVGYGPEKGALMKRAEERGVSSRCRFVGYQETAHPFLRISDVYVTASLSEGMSNALVESAMMGLPAVAHTGTHAGVVIPGETGHLFDAEVPDAAETFEAYVRELYCDRERARAMGAAARRRYLDNYTLDLQVERYADYYESL